MIETQDLTPQEVKFLLQVLKGQAFCYRCPCGDGCRLRIDWKFPRENLTASDNYTMCYKLKTLYKRAIEWQFIEGKELRRISPEED